MKERPVGVGLAGEKAGDSTQDWEAYPPNMRQLSEWLEIPESPPLRFTHSPNANPPVARRHAEITSLIVRSSTMYCLELECVLDHTRLTYLPLCQQVTDI